MWLKIPSESQAVRFRSPSPIRVGLVGAGFISTAHLKAIQSIPGTRIVGIADIIPHRAEQQAKRFGIPRFHGSLNQLLEDEFDVLHVTTPRSTHFELTMAGLRAQRDVFVEKPFTRSVAEADRLIDEAARQDRRILVDHSLLGDPGLIKARRFCDRGAIGRIHSVEIFRCGKAPIRFPPRPPYPDLGDPIREVGVHTLYCVCSILGEIRDGQGYSRKTGLQSEFELDEWSLNLECERGLGHIHLTWNGPPHQIIHIRGEQGQLRVDLSSGLMLHRRNWPGSNVVQLALNPVFEATSSLFQIGKRIMEFVFGKYNYYQGLHNFIQTYYGCLRTGDLMPVDYGSVRNVVEWVERLADSTEQAGRTRTTRLTPLRDMTTRHIS